MILRTLITNWLRQQAKERLYDVARDSVAGTNRDKDDSAPRPPCEIAIVLAVDIEAGGLVDLLGERVTTRCANFLEHSGFLNSLSVVVVESGVGQEAAARAMRDTFALHRLKWVISAGFAGSLHADLRRGHILMADEIVDARGHRLSVDLHVDRSSLAGKPGVQVGRLLTVDHLVRRVEEKHRLGNDHAALACDMESMAVGTVCREHGVRFLSVRMISDSVDDELPKDLQRLLDQKSFAAKFGATVGALLDRPATVKAMWQLKEDAIQASDRLAKFLAGVVANLPVEGK